MGGRTARTAKGAAMLMLAVVVAGSLAPGAAAATYANPVPVQIPGDGQVESCADPSVVRVPAADGVWWYAYCTTDPLNDADRSGDDFDFHLIPTLRSRDLVHWTYVGDAFTSLPSYASADAALWAPDIDRVGDQYRLYYTVNETPAPGDDAAIGVATAPGPEGPWTQADAPVVPPQDERWVFDPDVVAAGGQRYIFFGSYFGGVSARRLSADGLSSVAASETPITIPNRYEGTHIVRHGGFFYLLGSATNCCNGPLTGYSVFAGRSRDILGPYRDRDGVSLLAGRVGGTPVISMNGNRWVGPGHVTALTDFDGQDWLLLHAVDRFDPVFAGTADFTKRPLLLDPLDWIDGWPTVRAGRWASAARMPAPAAQPGSTTAYRPHPVSRDRLGSPAARLSDEFDGGALAPRWTWVREPAAGTFSVGGGGFTFETQGADLFEDSNSASVLTEPAPTGDWVVQTRVRLNVPAEGCCFNFVQAGLVAYDGDDNFVKLTHTSIFETRQTEFAKEQTPAPEGFPRHYGNTVVGPPSLWTTLRIVRRATATGERYTAYTRAAGGTWVRGGTWTHRLGDDARIGLVSMGGTDFTARFDYVRVWRLAS